MAHKDTEPFPPLNSAAANGARKNGSIARRRRKSSGLGSEGIGDNEAPALSTLAPGTFGEALQSPTEKAPRRSKRRTVKRILSKSKRLALKHTWLLPLVLATTIIALYLVNPGPHNPIAACLFLSYPIPQAPGVGAPIQDGKGARDFAFVGFYIIVLSFTREFIMQRLIRPIALSYGIKNKAKQARFMEQFYTALYFGVFGPFGVYVMSRSPVWYFNTTAMYEGFPHRTHEALFKAYYLLQASYWAQQMIVLLLGLEAPRKDFKELVAHHFITITLIWCSYRFHFTYMGIAVYITHDISDVFLATSKVLNYIDSPIMGPFFAVFMAVWGYLRHYINLKIIWSILTEFQTVGPFDLNWETQQYKCWISQYITFALMASLQAINLFWWFLICRIAYRFIVSWGEDVRDDRSEYEETDAEVEGEVEKNGVAPKTNGTANGTPKLLVNGELPSTPEKPIKEEEPVSTRLRERNKNQK